LAITIASWEIPPQPVYSVAHEQRTAEESTTVEMWELVAREHIRDTLARYNWSGDAGRLDDLADTFCADGLLEIRGFEPLRGRSEIVAFLGGVTGNIAASADVKPIVRHNVANLLFNEVTRDHARVSCYFTVVTHIGLDHVGRYRDTVVPDGDTWRIEHRKVSTDWAAPDSAMARPMASSGSGTCDAKVKIRKGCRSLRCGRVELF
jgi:hypothetical protein